VNDHAQQPWIAPGECLERIRGCFEAQQSSQECLPRTARHGLDGGDVERRTTGIAGSGPSAREPEVGTERVAPTRGGVELAEHGETPIARGLDGDASEAVRQIEVELRAGDAESVVEL
jgi:hypothetical protein